MSNVIIVVIFILLLSIIGRLLWEQRNFRRTLDFVLQHLDMAVTGAEQPVIYDESIDSAITEKLNQLVIISKMNCADADKNRNVVQALISDIAHQVKTPLTNIMLYSGLLREKALTQENQDMAEKIQGQSEKLDFFMKELVRSSYLEIEMISVHMELAEIDELIAEACQAVEVSALKKKIIFQIKECRKKGKFDYKWTLEALVNILDNAIKYSPEQSAIAVDTAFYESFFCIRVTDQGTGIEEQEQGAVFKRFYRSPRVAKEQGLGIGLYLVREIIEKQNGYVKVESSPGKSSTFSLYFPNSL